MVRHLLLTCLLLVISFAAAAAQPSDAQLDELLAVTRVRQMVDGTLPQLEQQQREMMQQALIKSGKTSPEDQHRAERIASITNKRSREILAWDSLAPMYRDLYRESFDADDIDAMLGFYKSAAG